MSIDLKQIEWPIKPDHVTKDGKYYIDNKELMSLNGLGIISNQYLQGLLSQFSINIKHPSCVFEFPPDKNSNPVKTYMHSYKSNIRKTCKKFRDDTNDLLCDEHDILIANIFRDVQQDNLKDHFNNYISSSTFKNQYNSKYPHIDIEKEFNLRNDNQDNRDYLEYSCPFLGYRELVFPIYFNQKVICVLFIGQLFIEDKDFTKNLLKITEGFKTHFNKIVNNNLNAVVDQIDVSENMNVNEKRINQIEKYVQKITAHEDQIFDYIIYGNSDNQEYQDRKEVFDILDLKTYNELINLTLKEIKQFEINLFYKFEKLKIEKINIHFNEYSELLNKKFKEIYNEDSDINILTNFWNKVEDVIKKLAEDFPVRFIKIFAKNELYSSKPNILEQVISTIDEYSEVIYNLNVVPKFKGSSSIHSNDIISHFTSQDDPELFYGIKSKNNIFLNIEYDLIRFLQSPINQNKIIIWIRYYNNRRSRLLEDNHTPSFKHFTQSVISLCYIISSAYSEVLSLILRQMSEKILRIFVHELGQIVPAIDGLRYNYIQNHYNNTHISEESLNKMNNDLIDYLNQLSFLENRAKAISNEQIVLNHEEFDIIQEIFNKWQKTLKSRCKEKKINILKATEVKKYKVYADKFYIEVLLYNVINNAIKYCYPGSNIYLDVNNDEDGFDIISIIDYGIDIPKDNKIYNFGFRGFERGIDDSGLGIGLNICKRIAKAHHGSICHEVIKILNYNIPYLKSFYDIKLQDYFILNRKGSKIQYGKDKLIMDEYKRIINEKRDLYKRIIAISQNENLLLKPTAENIINNINKPTYQVIFFIKIPKRKNYGKYENITS